MAPQAMGVIVGGPNGDGLGNASVSALQTHLAGQALPAFPFWDNLLRVSDSSGVYLGRNASTGRGWVITAAHVTTLAVGSGTVTVAGQAYTVRESHIIKHPNASGTANTDIRLYGIGGNIGDPVLPSLPAVPILQSAVVEGDALVLTGRGRRQQLPSEDITVPYDWDGAADEANQLTRQMRWGSNHVGIYTPAGSVLFPVAFPGPHGVTYFASVFDDPSLGGTAFEGQVALLDSGGGSFVRRGAAWFLAGTNSLVADGPDPDSIANPCGYGDFSIMAHLPSYRLQIETITGALVPRSADPLADLDGDGISNLMEYALNLDPLTNQQVIMTPDTGLSGLPVIRLETISGSKRLTIEFVRRTTASGAGLDYTPQFSSGLDDWFAVGTETVTSIDSRWDRVKVVDVLTTNDTSRRFARCKVEE
ncbi:MAG: hypothetical protein ACKO2G_16170 [Verrucomicrobiales bacterium]